MSNKRLKRKVPASMRRPMPILVIGDTHAPATLPDYLDFLITTYNYWGCKHAVHIGDLVDNYALSFHEKEIENTTQAYEYRDALDIVHQYTRAFPNVDLTLGNHDVLAARKGTAQGIPQLMMRSFRDIWDLPSSWNVVPRFHDLLLYDEDDQPFICRHGDKGPQGKYSFANAALQAMASVIRGHQHQLGGVYTIVNDHMCVQGMNVGCGVDHRHPNMKYGKSFAHKPVIGCGVIISASEMYFIPMKRGSK